MLVSVQLFASFCFVLFLASSFCFKILSGNSHKCFHLWEDITVRISCLNRLKGNHIRNIVKELSGIDLKIRQTSEFKILA